MHVRVSRVRRNGKLYEYAQLVESYRRPSDGMPAHRVVANLGPRSEVEIANLKAALRAGRKGEQVVVASAEPAQAAKIPKPSANLRYLDVAVLVEVWRELDLGGLLGEVMPVGEAELAPADVVAALAIQRCTDPGSKLFATRWLPRTALPELLGIAPSKFNNTRLHRVLDSLDAATPALMRRLPELYLKRDGAFAAFFLDVTDTWFEGHGPAMAERGKTKEEMLKRKVGIVLLCNEHGYPLRWQVVSGNRNDSKVMAPLVRHLGGKKWASQIPLVMDRAMGCSAHLRELSETGIHFITALVSTEFPTYAASLPHEKLAELQPDDGDAKKTIDETIRRLTRHGFRKIRGDRLIRDLGIVEPSQGPKRYEELEEDHTTRAMTLCRRITAGVANGTFASYRAAGRALGLGSGVVNKYRALHNLAEELQQAVLDGAVAGRALRDLIAVSSVEDEQRQREAFEALKQKPPARPTNKPGVDRRSRHKRNQAPLRLRVVACFHPERFVTQRRHAQRTLAQIEHFVCDLNSALASGANSSSRQQVVAAVDRVLRENEVLRLYTPTISERPSDDGPRLQVKLDFDRAEWSRRRSSDGFTVFVAHPDIALDDAAIDQLYWDKDRVEKDFRVIKSLVKLRPVHHRTDAKVRAHVTLCMLALVLERALGQKLQHTPYSPERALELLATCHLNEYRAQRGDAAYTITTPDDDQAHILRALRLQHLAEDDRLMARITPR